MIEGEEFETFEKEFDMWAGGPGQTHYEAYPVLFDRTIPWESKEPLLKQIHGNNAAGGGGNVKRQSNSSKNPNNKKANEE